MQWRIDGAGVWDGEGCCNCTVLLQPARRARLQFAGRTGANATRVRANMVRHLPAYLVGTTERAGEDMRPGNVTVKVVPSSSDEVKLSEPPR